MAFSTQKDFFYVPFMNEDVEFECRRECVTLKSYDSTFDDRSWAMDETQQSNFLSDLVTCRTPIGIGRGGGVGGGSGGGGGVGGRGIGPASGRMGKGATGADGSIIGDSFFARHGLTAGDSVMECATVTLGKFEDILIEKQNLQKQLDVSNERLRTADEENRKIKSIMQQKYDSNQVKDFYNIIQKLTSSGKLSKAEENELMTIHHKMEDMTKAYEVLQAENCYLKRLCEKISRRATLESIKLDPETSTDIHYLQNTVNTLRKEVNMLRKMEDDKLKEKHDLNQTRLSDRDAENLKAIIKERNALREKCKSFKDLEKKVQLLQKKTREADHLSDSLSSNLENQSKYIGEMEKEMKGMQSFYEDQVQKTKYAEECMKCQCEELKEELMRAKCEAQKAEILQMEVACLRNEITKRDVALSDYDCQYKQLMCVINELQGGAQCNTLQDTQTQTCDDAIDDLAFFASATLEEIAKELTKRGKPGIGDTYSELMHGLEESPSYYKEYDRGEKKDAMKDESKYEMGDRTKDESKYDIKDESKYEMKDESKYEMKDDSKYEMKDEPKYEMKDELKDDSKFEVEGEIKDVPKYETRDEIKDDMRDESKDKLEEKTKEEMKDESRDQLKGRSSLDKTKSETKDQVQVDKKEPLRDDTSPLKEENIPVKSQENSNKEKVDECCIEMELLRKKVAELKTDSEKKAMSCEEICTEALKKLKELENENERLQKTLTEKSKKLDEFKDKISQMEKEMLKSATDTADTSKQMRQSLQLVKEISEVQDKNQQLESAVNKLSAKDDQKAIEELRKKNENELKKINDLSSQLEALKKQLDAEKEKSKTCADDKEKLQSDLKKKDNEASLLEKKLNDEKKSKSESEQKKTPAEEKKQTVEEKKKETKPSEGKKGTQEEKKSTDDKKKPAEEEKKKPTVEEKKPVAEEKKPVVEEKKPVGEEKKPKEEEKKQTVEEKKPVGEEKKPTGGEKKTAGGEKKPVGEEKKPVGEEKKPTGGEKKTAGAEKKPVGEQKKPVGEEKKPAGGEKKPVGEEKKPVGEEKKPTGGEKKPVGEEKKPTGGETKPVEEEKKPEEEETEAAREEEKTTEKDETPTRGETPTTAETPTTGEKKTADEKKRGDGKVKQPTTTDKKRKDTDSGDKDVKKVSPPDGNLTVPKIISHRSAQPSTKGNMEKGRLTVSDEKNLYQEFVNKNAVNISANVKAGGCLEKELRAILDAFIQECGFAFCQCRLPKSKFYCIVYKILHNGLASITFREIVYVHKKIYLAAERTHPGCLLNMILAEQPCQDGQRMQCCNCKNVLCCNNSEEMLKEKVIKLERDIEMAKEYLDHFKACPHSNDKTYRQDQCDCTRDGVTYRRPDQSQSKRVSNSKQLKQFKARLLNCSTFFQ